MYGQGKTSRYMSKEKEKDPKKEKIERPYPKAKSNHLGVF
jgi:hypothetical protein